MVPEKISTSDEGKDSKESEKRNVQKAIQLQLHKIQEDLNISITNAEYRADGLMTSFTLGKHSVDCGVVPESEYSIQSTLRALVKSLERIRQNKELVDSVDKGIPIRILDTVRFDLTITKGDQSFIYTATPFDAFQVIEAKIDFTTDDEKKSIPSLEEIIKKGSSTAGTTQEAIEAAKAMKKVAVFTAKKNGRRLIDSEGKEILEYQGGDAYTKRESVNSEGIMVVTEIDTDPQNYDKLIVSTRVNNTMEKHHYNANLQLEDIEKYENGSLLTTDHFIDRNGAPHLTHRLEHKPNVQSLYNVSTQENKPEFVNPFNKDTPKELIERILEAISTKEEYSRF